MLYVYLSSIKIRVSFYLFWARQWGQSCDDLLESEWGTLFVYAIGTTRPKPRGGCNILGLSPKGQIGLFYRRWSYHPLCLSLSVRKERWLRGFPPVRITVFELCSGATRQVICLFFATCQVFLYVFSENFWKLTENWLKTNDFSLLKVNKRMSLLSV